MIFKFKNGYSVKIDDAGDKTKEELQNIAWAAVCSVKDAASLEKNIDTNVSFMATKLKEAIASENKAMYRRELQFLLRDLNADLTEAHKNYKKLYRTEVLEKLLKQYEDAANLVAKADAKFGASDEDIVREKIKKIRENWDLDTTAAVKDAQIDSIEKKKYPKSHIDIREVEKLRKALENNPPEKDGEPYYPPDFDEETLKMEDAGIPEYRVRITYENGEVTVKFMDSLTDAVNDIRTRIRVGRRNDNRVVEALVFDTYTDEVILSSNRDDDIKIDDTKVRDIPYYDPTDYPAIKSDYSIDRLKKEFRHPERPEPLTDEFREVIDEIDDLISQGSEALVEAGWSKDDARHAIAYRYRELEKDLRKAKLLENARELRNKIKELEKVWDLRV